MFSLKQKIPVCVVLLIIALIASSTVSFAHSVSHPSSVHTTSHLTSQIHPSFSGGGCSGSSYSGPSSSYARYNSCISAMWNIPIPFAGVSLAPDTYVTYGARNPNLWSYCSISIDIVNGNGNFVAHAYSTDCLGDARASRANVHYGGDTNNYCDSCVDVGGGSYYGKVQWVGVYNGKVISGYYVFSPEQFV